MKPADRSGAAVLDRPAVVDDSETRPTMARELVTYDVLLLAGEPRRQLCLLPVGVEAGTDIEVAGALWTVADVRGGDDRASATLICIYAE